MASLHKKLTLTCLFLLSCLLASCGPKAGEDVVAQVGSTTLTTTDLKSQFPTEFENLVTKEQYLHYIKRWMDEEVLFQKAQEEGVDEQDDVKKRIHELTKKVVVEAYIAEQLRDLKYEPEEHLVQQYYQTHASEFSRSEAEVRFAVLEFNQKDTATKVSKILNSENLPKLLSAYKNSEKEVGLLNLPYLPLALIDTCFNEKIQKMPINTSSEPLECGSGIKVIYLLDRQSKGSIRSLSEVNEEIKNLLRSEWQAAELDKMVTTLRKDLFFTTQMHLVPGVQDSVPKSKNQVPKQKSSEPKRDSLSAKDNFTEPSPQENSVSPNSVSTKNQTSAPSTKQNQNTRPQNNSDGKQEDFNQSTLGQEDQDNSTNTNNSNNSNNTNE